MRENQFWVVMLILALTSAPAFSAQFTFTPRVSVIEEYNDNIDLDRKDKKDDFITTVSPGFTAEWFGQTAGLRASYDPAYSIYADHDEFNGWSHRLLGTAWNDLSRFTRLELSNYFLYTKDPLADEDLEDPRGNILVQGNDRRRRRDTYYRDIATARVDHRFGPENSAFGQMLYGILRYDDPFQEDSEELSPSAGLVYWFSSWWGMELEGEYTRGLYDENLSSDFHQVQGRWRVKHRTSPRFGQYGEYKQIYRDVDESGLTQGDGDIENDYFVYAPSAGVFYEFEKDLTASFGIGWFYQQIQERNDQYGPFISAVINKLWNYQRWSIRARGSSGIDSQDFSDQNLGFERYLQAELIGRYNFTRQLYADAGLRYRWSDFINSEDDEMDHRYTVDAGLGYEVLRWMSIRLAYGFEKLDNINGTDDYEQNRVYMTLTLQPDQPWRW